MTALSSSTSVSITLRAINVISTTSMSQPTPYVMTKTYPLLSPQTHHLSSPLLYAFLIIIFVFTLASVSDWRLTGQLGQFRVAVACVDLAG